MDHLHQHACFNSLNSHVHGFNSLNSHVHACYELAAMSLKNWLKPEELQRKTTKCGRRRTKVEKNRKVCKSL